MLAIEEIHGGLQHRSMCCKIATYLWRWSYNHQEGLRKLYRFHDVDPALHPASKFSVQALIRDSCKSSRLQSKPRVLYLEPSQMGAHSMDRLRMPRTGNGLHYNLSLHLRPDLWEFVWIDGMLWFMVEVFSTPIESIPLWANSRISEQYNIVWWEIKYDGQQIVS